MGWMGVTMNFPKNGVAMRISTKRVIIGIFALLIPFIPASKAYSSVRIIPRHFAAKADFVPIKMWTRWKFTHRLKEFACLDAIFNSESHWNPKAHNTQAVWMGGKAYYAGGIPQLLGLKTSVNPYRQVSAGINYVNRRYQSPCRALTWHLKHGWY